MIFLAMLSKVQHSITALYYHCRCKGKQYKVFLMETSTIIINALMANNFNSEKGTSSQSVRFLTNFRTPDFTFGGGLKLPSETVKRYSTS